MNVLSNTQLFKTAIEQFPSLKNVFDPRIIPNYAIPDSFYNHYYKIFQNKKHPLTKYMLQLARESRIGLVNFSDPMDLKHKAVLLPPYFTCIAGKTENNKKVVVYANAAKRAGFKRNVKNQEIESLKIDEMSLFGYLYSATVSYIIMTKSTALENNVRFVSTCAEFYVNMINRCISGKQYPIVSNINDYTRLNFIVAMFFLQTFVKYDAERALNTAFKIKIIDKNIIEKECLMYSNEELVISSFDMLVKALEKEFSFIRQGDITIRSVAYHFCSMYGETALFALEHFQSFVNMIINAHLGTNHYNDLSIKKTILTHQIANIEQALLMATGD